MYCKRPEGQAADPLRRRIQRRHLVARPHVARPLQRHEGVQEQNAALRDARRAAHPAVLVHVGLHEHVDREAGGEVQRDGRHGVKRMAKVTHRSHCFPYPRRSYCSLAKACLSTSGEAAPPVSWFGMMTF